MSEATSPPSAAQPAGTLPAYYAACSAPLVTTTALIVDTRGRVLVLALCDRDQLVLPGGLVAEGELPEEGLARELREELNLNVPVGRLLAVDSGDLAEHGRAVVAHVHLIGPLNEQQVAGISFPDAEITAAHWYAPNEAVRLLPERMAGRLQAGLMAWHAGSVAHLAMGRAQPGSPVGLQADEREELERGYVDPASFRAMRPKVLAGATVLFTDTAQRVLLVQPAYRTDGLWHLPGGGVDSDLGEYPRQAARREVREELGLDVPLGRLLAVNWANDTPHPSRVGYTFSGGVLGEADLARIRIDGAEISRWRMAKLSDIPAMVAPALYQRIEACLAALRGGNGPLELYGGSAWG